MAYYPYFPPNYHYPSNWSQSGAPPTSAPPSTGPPGAIQFGSFPPTQLDAAMPYPHQQMYYPYVSVMPYGYPHMPPQQPGGQPPHGVPPPSQRNQPRHDRSKPRQRMGAPHRERPDSRNSHREHHQELKEQPPSRSETPTQTHKEPTNHPSASSGYLPPSHSTSMSMHQHPHPHYPMHYYYTYPPYMSGGAMPDVDTQYHQKPRIPLEPNSTPVQGSVQTSEPVGTIPQPSPTPTAASRRRLPLVNPNTNKAIDDASSSFHASQADRQTPVPRVDSHHSSKPTTPRHKIEIDKCVSEVLSDTNLERPTSTKLKSKVGKTELKTEENPSIKKAPGRYPVQSQGQPKIIDPSNGKYIPGTFRNSAARLQESPVVLSKAKDTSASIASDVLKTVQSVERRVEEEQSTVKTNEIKTPEKAEAAAMILDPSKGVAKVTAEVVIGTKMVAPVKTEVTDLPMSHPVAVTVGTPQTESSTPTKLEKLEMSKSDEPEEKSVDDAEKEPIEVKADTPTKNVYSPQEMQEFKEQNKGALPDMSSGPWMEGTETETPTSPVKEHLVRRSSSKQGSRGLSRRNSSIRSRHSKSDPEDVFHISSKKHIYTMDFLQSLREKFTDKPQFQESLQCMRDVDGPQLRRHPSDKWSNKKGAGFDSKTSIGRSPSGREWKNEPGRGSSSGRRITRLPSSRGAEETKWGKTDINMLSPFAPNSGPELHHTENRYVVGEILSDDPEEEKRQKIFKGLLNKLTPSNFARMYEKFKEVEIRDPKTLKGLIDQIFDKALTETTFCPLYSDLCKLLTSEMPEFEEEGDRRKLTFRRLLLNKCQNEFEKGDAAVRAAEEAEAADPSAMSAEERKLRLSTARKERLRSLGNTQFIGFLFKKGMLTERIIHNCIVDLLREEEKPKPEDIECLCKLISTVGELLPKQEVVNAYFCRIDRLSKSPKLETRHKFMLLDLIELKDRDWIARREKEGPKKIEEIHRDAQMEQMAQNARNRGGYSGNYMGRNTRGTAWSRSNTTTTRSSTFNAHEEVKPLTRNLSLGRTASQDISLRPSSIGKVAAMSMPRPRSRSPQRTPQPAPIQETKDEEPKGPVLEGEELKRKAKGLTAEYYNSKDMDEALQGIQELFSANAQKPEVLKNILLASLEIRGVEVDERLKPIEPLLKALLAREMYDPTDAKRGLQMTMMALPEVADEFPRAPILIARMLGSLVSEKIIPLRTMLDANGIILGAGRDELPSEEDDNALVDSGSASQMLIELLTQMKIEETEERSVRDAVNREDADLLLFYPSYLREDADLTEELSFLD